MYQNNTSGFSISYTAPMGDLPAVNEQLRIPRPEKERYMTLFNQLLLIITFFFSSIFIPCFAENIKNILSFYSLGGNIRQQPEISIAGSTIPFGQKLVVLKTSKNNWIFVENPDTGNKGWIHRAEVISSEDQVNKMKNFGLLPNAILHILNIRNKSNYDTGIFIGPVTLDKNTKHMIPKVGNCLVFADEKYLSSKNEISLIGFGVSQSILSPKPWTLYCYSSQENQFRSIVDTISDAEKGRLKNH